MVTFLILSFLDILEDLLKPSISVATTCLLSFSVSLHVSAPNSKLLLIKVLEMFNFRSFLASYVRKMTAVNEKYVQRNVVVITRQY